MDYKDYYYRQGRTKGQVENSYKTIEWSFKLLAICIVLTLLFA
jgi:hypothetical protein